MDKILTKRLIIQKATTQDAGLLSALLADRELCRLAHLVVPGESRCREESLALLINSMTIYLLRLRGRSNRLVGLIMVDHYYDHQGLTDEETREIGYLLAQSFWSQGLMTEALASLVPLLIQNYSLIGIADCTNQASQKLLSRLGFQQKGHSAGQILWKKEKKLALNNY